MLIAPPHNSWVRGTNPSSLCLFSAVFWAYSQGIATFFFLRKLQFRLVSLSKPQWCCDLSVLTMRGDKAEKLIKITHKEIYADVFILSQMLLLGSLGVECELHEGWAKWETFEGKLIIDGLVPPSDFWLWFSLVHYQGHLSGIFPHSCSFVSMQEDVNFHVSRFLTSVWHMVLDIDTLLGFAMMLPFWTICFKSLVIYVLVKILLCLIFI